MTDTKSDVFYPFTAVKTDVKAKHIAQFVRSLWTDDSTNQQLCCI